jgi:hypothetical protein
MQEIQERAIRIEANVTYKCNAVCEHCNKAVGLVKFQKADMTVEQMRQAVDQLIEQKIDVRRFTFCGGEPIAHPHLQELINEAARLPGVRYGFRILTNGLRASEEKRAAIDLPKRFQWVVNAIDDIDDPLSGKNDPLARPNRRYHTPFWVSPADVGLESKFENCTVKGWCGIGLDSTGWSMCGKARMFGELFGIDPSMKEGDIMQHVSTGIPEICKHCQYGLEDGGRSGRRMRGMKGPAHEIDRQVRQGKMASISPTFVAAFAQHKEQPLIQLERF